MKRSKKVIYAFLCVLLCIAASLCLLACGPEKETPPPSNNTQTPGDNTQTPGDNTQTPGDNTQTPGGEEEKPSPEKKNYDMSAIKWDYANPFTYDGTEKTVAIVSGLPDGVTIKSYVSASETDAGTYTASVNFNYDEANYNKPTATLGWTINKAEITAEITLSSKTFEYDTQMHSLQIVGNVPSGVTAEYYYNDVKQSGVSAVGEYNVKCILSGKNYNSKTLTATLKITTTEKQLYSAFVNGKAFFQNDLDGDKLYFASGSTVTKVNNDIPNYMIASGNDLYYFGTSLFSKVIKQYDGNKASTLFNLSGEYLATDGTNIYYAVNNALINTAENGIYKLALNASSDAVPTRLTTDKAEYLTYCDGYIYYSNKSQSGKLYRISSSASNGAGTELHDEKVEYIISDGSGVFFNSTKTVAGVGVASAVSKYLPSQNKVIKLTTDSGKYLTKIGNYIYYVNNDKLTTALFGDGICRVSAELTSDSSLPGDKIISAENGDGYSSLASDGTNLYFYKLNDKHFYRYNISGQTETDLMANFTPPAETVTLTGYANVTEHDGEIYYTDPRDNSSLYKYNPSAKSTFKVLAESVSNVYFNGEYMYYSTYVLTNYALFRLKPATGESEKILPHRYENLIFENGKIYGIRITGIGNNQIVEIDPEATDDDAKCRIIYNDKSPKLNGFAKFGNDYYFITTATVNKYIYKYTDGAQKAEIVNDKEKAENFVICDNRFYYTSGSDLKSYAIDGSDVKTVQTGKDVNDIYVSGNKIYFSLDNTNKGLYVYDTVAGGTPEKIDASPAHGMTVYNGKLYFLRTSVSYANNYPVHASGYDGKLYCYDGAKTEAV